MPTAIAERRATDRVPMQVTITLTSHNNFWAGLTEDISEGGVFVVSYTDLPVYGQSFDLVLHLGGKVITATGWVRWVRDTDLANAEAPPGFGLAFEQLSDDDLALVRRFVGQYRSTMLFDA